MKKGYFFILIATIAFSSMEVVLKLIAGEVNPVQLTLARFSIGFVFLAPVAVYTLKKRSKRLDRKSVAYFALLGLIGIAICMPIYQMSINFTESSVVAVLFSCNPVFVTFFAFMILKEPIKRRHLAALSLEILGTLAIINPLHIKLNMVGVGLALCSTVLFSIYGVMGKRKCAEYGGAVVTCFSFLFGSVIIFCFILIPFLEGYTLQNLPYVLYVSAGVAGVGFCAYFLAMEYQPASVVSLVYFFKPALSPILAWMVHGEEIPGNMLAGILLILAGSFANIIPGILEIRRAKQQMPSN